MLKAKGVKQIDRNQLLSIGTPDATSSYCPISNYEIVNTALEELDRQGFRLKSEFHKTDSSMSKFVGGFIVSGGDSEMDLMFGYKNSYDKSMSAAYALGVSVMICSNSAVRGEEMMIRKHTGEANIVLKKAISEGITRLGDNFNYIKNDFNKLKEIDVTKKTMASLIGQLYLNEEIIKSHQLSILKKELEEESYIYGVENTAYNLYQDITHSLKNSHPTSFIKDHANLHRFFVNEFGLLVQKQELELV
jgi:hypothetical protein